MKLHLEVITPTKVVLSEEVDEIIINTASGEITILPNHIDLLTKLVPGEMIVKTGSKTQSFAVNGGFLEISNNKVSILADYAVRAADIEIAKAKEAKEQAEKVMKNKEVNKAFVVAEAELRKALLELKVATKHHSSRLH
jgi:F-type H+-transporting ATPase subunit epsilon